MSKIDEARSLADRLLDRRFNYYTNEEEFAINGEWGVGPTERELDLQHIMEEANHGLPGFVTLEPALLEQIGRVLNTFSRYEDDRSRMRPHNLLMAARPGSGKSHLVRCLASQLEMPLVSANLGGPDAQDILIYAVNAARNHKAEDKIPLIFLDEADSHLSTIPLLLPLLWDGEITAAGQTLKIGRCIIVCAVSRHRLIAQISGSIKPLPNRANDNLLPQTTELGEEHIPKEEDFLSRFDAGALNIPSLSLPDRLCMVGLFLKRRFPNLEFASMGLIQFLTYVPIMYEARSIEFLVNMLPKDEVVETFTITWEETQEGDEYHTVEGIGVTESVVTSRRPISSTGIRIRNEGVMSTIGDSLTPNGYRNNPLRFHLPTSKRAEALKLWKRSIQLSDPVWLGRSE